MMKKFFLLLFLTLFLSGCTSQTESSVTLKFSTWGSASEMSILKPIIDDFEKQNPSINIELMHIPQNYFQKIHLLFASNLAPDVIFINNLNLPVYANHLEPLELSTDMYYQQPVAALSYNGRLLAVPRDVSNLLIYYNKDLFDLSNGGGYWSSTVVAGNADKGWLIQTSNGLIQQADRNQNAGIKCVKR